MFAQHVFSLIFNCFLERPGRENQAPLDQVDVKTDQICNTILDSRDKTNKVIKYISKRDILRSTLYKRFLKIKDEMVKSRI